MVAHRRRIPGVGKAMNSAGNHSADVGVDDGNRLAVGEAGDRASRVRADPGQFKQCLDVVGHYVAVFGRDHRSAFVQSLGSARVAELAPRAQYVGRTRCRRRRGRRPPCDPVHPNRRNPRHWGLLQHELTDQDLPGGHIGSTPRQFALRAAVPLHEIIRRDAHRMASAVAVHNTVHAEHHPRVRLESTQGG